MSQMFNWLDEIQCKAFIQVNETGACVYSNSIYYVNLFLNIFVISKINKTDMQIRNSDFDYMNILDLLIR